MGHLGSVWSGVAAMVALSTVVSCKTAEPWETDGSLEPLADVGSSYDDVGDDLGDDWVSVTESSASLDLPPPPTAAPAVSGVDRTHQVRKGDTLFALARHYYGDASKWRLILESNRDVIRDADMVKVGQTLRIP